MAEYIKLEDAKQLLLGTYDYANLPDEIKEETVEGVLKAVPAIAINYDEAYIEYLRSWDVLGVLVKYYGGFWRVPRELRNEILDLKIKAHGERADDTE